MNSPHPVDTAPTGHRRFLVKLTIIATLGGLLFGYDTGVISGALLSLREDLSLTSMQEGVVVSSLLFGAMFGALLGGKMADRLGRRGSLLICAGLFLFGALGSALAPDVTIMVIARIVLGLGVGAASVTVPVFLAEMAPADRRGRMVTINELMIVTGQFLAFAINSLLDQLIDDVHVWRWMLGVSMVPAIVLLIGMCVLPDSPRWYAIKGRLTESRHVLDLSRPEREAAEEYQVIVTHAESELLRDRGAALRDLRAFPWMRRLLLIGIGLAVASQATGVNTINYYAPTILESTGLGASAALILTITVGAVSIVGTIIGIVLLGHFNRRPLLLTGFSGIVAAHVALALVFLLPDSMMRTYAVLGAMLLFMFFMQTFVGIGTWLLLSEIFPMTIRGFAMGVAVFMLWTANTIISFVFPIINSALGSTGTFAIFAVINVASLTFLAKTLPETRGRTLEELEDDFRNHGTRAAA
ncbi:sugar porter family MFS transporter [Rhodococcus koreensis]